MRYLDALDHWVRSHTTSIVVVGVGLAFGVRIVAAIPEAFNPDEACNLMSARGPTLFRAVANAMDVTTHPPLYSTLVWATAQVHRADLFLRLPWVIFGAAGAGVAFLWLRSAFGLGAGLAGLVLFGFVTPLIELSSEARAYSLQVLLIVGAAHALLLGETSRSPSLLAGCGALLAIAVATHYSSLIAASALGLYALVRIVRGGWDRRMAAGWALGQLAAVAMSAAMWVVGISHWRGGALESQTQSGWLRFWYFHADAQNPIVFLGSRTVDLFKYVLEFQWLGYAALLLLALVFVRRWDRPSPSSGEGGAAGFASPRTLFVLPFAVASAVALSGAYPYGGTRHSIYLGVFALGAVSFALGQLAGRRVGLLLAGLLALAPLWTRNALESRWDPALRRERVLEAIEELAATRESASIVLVDMQAEFMIRHYRCPDSEPVPVRKGWQELGCDGLRLAAARTWDLKADHFDATIAELEAAFQLAPGARVRFVTMGWEENVVAELESRGRKPLNVRSFGPKVAFADVVLPLPGSGPAP